jgi:hypothetical protein
MNSLNRVKLRNGLWLEGSSVLRIKSAEFHSATTKQEVILYGLSVLPNPEKSMDLLEVGFADFLKAPWVEAIDFSQFNGRKGSRILVHLEGGNKAEKATIQIFNWDGSIAIESVAEKGLFPTEWVFTLSKDNPQAWSRITILIEV